MYLCFMVQAYHNELVGKVSRLEEENVKLKKEKVLDLIHVLFSPLCSTFLMFVLLVFV